MNRFNGITFAPFGKRGVLTGIEAKKSFDYMIEHTGADSVILAPFWVAESCA